MIHRSRKLSLMVVLFGLFLWSNLSTTAHAQSNDPTAFQLQRFRPWGDPQGMFNTQSAQALGQWNYTVGVFFNYANRPLAGTGPNQQDQVGIINHQIGADIMAGIGFLSWLEVYVNIPLTIYQVGAIPNLNSVYGNAAGQSLDGFFLGDIKLGVKFRILDEKKFGVSLGLKAFVGLPTTAPTPLSLKMFNGEDPISAGAMFLLSKKISIVHLAFNVGYRFNPETTLANVTISHELFYGLAASFEVIKRRLEIIADIHGSVSLVNTNIRSIPLELDLGVRIYPLSSKSLALNIGAGAPLSTSIGTPLVRVFFGLVWSPEQVPDTDGDGLNDNVDQCPKVPGPRDNQGCPWPDTDGDGLKDNVDKCPKTPGPKENKGCPHGDRDGDGLKDNADKCPDKPGPQANQGCPWPDTDGDGLTDNVDKCPKEKGPKENKGCPWGDADQDGTTDNLDRCPKTPGPKSNRGCPLAIMKQKKIEITQKVFFDFNKAKIKTVSYPVLDAVAAILKKYNRVKIRIEGHTDDVGDADYNLKLSNRRARSVRAYLISKGIPGSRLTSKGYGKTVPLIQAKTPEARAKNRRVEFVITSQ